VPDLPRRDAETGGFPAWVGLTEPPRGGFGRQACAGGVELLARKTRSGVSHASTGGLELCPLRRADLQCAGRTVLRWVWEPSPSPVPAAGGRPGRRRRGLWRLRRLRGRRVRGQRKVAPAEYCRSVGVASRSRHAALVAGRRRGPSATAPLLGHGFSGAF